MFEPGSLVGNYRMLHLLGKGGMGVVYAAEHVYMGRKVALKVLHAEIAQNEEIARRFWNEARAAAMLDHRNVAEAFEFGQAPNGQWFIAMKFLDGESLSSFIGRYRQEGTPIPLATIVAVIAEAACGLEAAHAKGLVHRDIKPDNLFLRRTDDGDDYTVVVLDFGIAKLGGHTQGAETRDYQILGTLPYMSLEALRNSAKVDGRCDVYSLACVAFEMATGALPRGTADTPTEMMERQLVAPAPPDPRAIRADLPEGFAEVIQRGLAAHPDHRFESPSAFAVALAHALPTQGWSPSGIAILERRARELLKASPEDKTIGRAVPLIAQSPMVTAPMRPGARVGQPTPHTVSDGVPRTPGYAPPAAAAAPLTTNAFATGESVSVPARAPSAARRRRPALVIAAAATGAITVAAVIALVVTGGNRESRDPDPVAAAPDAGAPSALADAAPTVVMSALAIVTEPPGAEVRVDGAPQGRAPVNVPLAAGVEVVVQVELAGHQPVTETVRVGATPEAVRLTLTPVAAPNAAAVAPIEEPRSRRRSGGRRRGGDGEPPAEDPGSKTSGNPDEPF